MYLGKYTVQPQSSPNYNTTMQQDLDAEVEKKNGSDPELHKIDTEKTRIILNVTDELTSSALEGAVFTVTNRRTGTTQTVATDGAGQIRLTDLDKSTTYLIREQQAPGNYRPDDTDHTVTVAADGRIDGAGSATLDITNRLLRVSISAVDTVLRSNTEGEQLSLYNEQDQLIRSWTSSDSGQLFTDLTEGRLLRSTRQGRFCKCPEISLHCTGYGKYAELDRAGVYAAQCGGSGRSGCGRRRCGLAAGVPVGHPCTPPQGAESCCSSGRDPRPERK